MIFFKRLFYTTTNGRFSIRRRFPKTVRTRWFGGRLVAYWVVRGRVIESIVGRVRLKRRNNTVGRLNGFRIRHVTVVRPSRVTDRRSCRVVIATQFPVDGGSTRRSTNSATRTRSGYTARDRIKTAYNGPYRVRLSSLLKRATACLCRTVRQRYATG